MVKRPLKIAQVAPIIERVPPKKYGGTERVIYNLCEELVERGHEVTLFASGDSQTSAELFSVYPQALRETRIKNVYGANPWTLLNIGSAYLRQDEFDVIHDHIGSLSLATAAISKTPVVATIHGAITNTEKMLLENLVGPNLVTISKAQAKPAPTVNFAGCVYNGLNMESYPFSKKEGKYLLFVGRISAEKGLHFAIRVAKHLGIPLLIAAKLERYDLAYFKDYIEKEIDNKLINWVGEVEEDERNKLMSKALCLLQPVTWEEPFGLTMIEAMACGSPVVAFRRGSVPEVVKDGVSGFAVDNFEQMLDAVKKIHKIGRRACRDYALKNFSARKMADGYEDIYYKVVKERRISDTVEPEIFVPSTKFLRQTLQLSTDRRP